MLRIILWGGLLLLSGRASGQSADVFWTQPTAGANLTGQLLLQSGNGNPVSSAINIHQIGTANQLTYRQQGVGNAASFQQAGDANRLEVNLIGENNRLSFDQAGNKNLLIMSDLRTSNGNLQVIQRGDGNELIRQGTLSQGVPMRIEQTGGMHLILTNGNP